MNQNSELKAEEQWLLELVDDLDEAKKRLFDAQQQLLAEQAHKEAIEAQFFNQARKVKAMRKVEEILMSNNLDSKPSRLDILHPPL